MTLNELVEESGTIREGTWEPDRSHELLSHARFLR